MALFGSSKFRRVHPNSQISKCRHVELHRWTENCFQRSRWRSDLHQGSQEERGQAQDGSWIGTTAIHTAVFVHLLVFLASSLEVINAVQTLCTICSTHLRVAQLLLVSSKFGPLLSPQFGKVFFFVSAFAAVSA